MAYLDVISLADAKTYLRLDDTLSADDNAIIRMIKSALSYIEMRTNVIIYQRDKTYLMVDGCAKIYDYPINSLSTPADAEATRKNGFTNYIYGSDTTDLTLSVGYADPDDIPKELIDVAYEIIDIFYYEHETGKSIDKDLSAMSQRILDEHKRFII